MRTVATLRDAPSAYIAASLLEAEGIACEIRDEHAVGVDWFLSLALGGVKLLVAEDGFARAAAILGADHSAALPDAEALRCPACASANVRAPRNRRIAGALSLAFGIPIVVREGRWRCRSCGHRWRARPEQTPSGTQNP